MESRVCVMSLDSERSDWSAGGKICRGSPPLHGHICQWNASRGCTSDPDGSLSFLRNLDALQRTVSIHLLAGK
ncbi:unnamed protein product [Leuciscus chuanchicus]